jgi:hypothetical protein
VEEGWIDIVVGGLGSYGEDVGEKERDCGRRR